MKLKRRETREIMVMGISRQNINRQEESLETNKMTEEVAYKRNG